MFIETPPAFTPKLRRSGITKIGDLRRTGADSAFPGRLPGAFGCRGEFTRLPRRPPVDVFHPGSNPLLPFLNGLTNLCAPSAKK